MRDREHRKRGSPCMFTLLSSETVPLSRSPRPRFSASLWLAWSPPFNCLGFLKSPWRHFLLPLARDGFCLSPTESLTQPVIQGSRFIQWAAVRAGGRQWEQGCRGPWELSHWLSRQLTARFADDLTESGWSRNWGPTPSPNPWGWDNAGFIQANGRLPGLFKVVVFS